jgi:acetoin utilization protein AcuB
VASQDNVGDVTSTSRETEEERKQRRKRQQIRAGYGQKQDGKRALGALVASKVMSTPPVTVEASESVASARKKLLENNLSQLPVVSSDGVVVGLIAQSNILTLEDVESFQAATVQDLMVTQVLTATLDTPLKTLARVLAEEGLGCLPIVDSAGQILGVLTTGDVLRTIVERSPVELHA